MGAWQEIVDYTVPSNTNTVTIDNFGTITKDDFIKIEMTYVNASSSVSDIKFLPNSSVVSNFHHQYIHVTGTGVSASRSNDQYIGFAIGSQTAKIISYLKLSENDRANFMSNSNGEITSGVRNDFNYNTSSGATFPSGITSFTVRGSQTNALGTGSRIQIYKLAAEKVADITVGSNTQQVDISSLSIDKDSEYLLVSDVLNTVASAVGYFIKPNDLSNSDFAAQRIVGNNTSATAGRFTNLPYAFETAQNFRSVAYSHIKLSNIGAYTHQAYSVYNAESTIPFVHNSFASSYLENITSITKLNILSGIANGIATGSRFQLYKLK
jgi:hypothetical protein